MLVMAGKPKCGCSSVADCTCTELTCRVCKQELPIEKFWYGGKRFMQCIDCKREKDRAYAEKNKEARRAGQAAYYRNNSDRLKEYGKRYRSENAERLAEYRRERQQRPEYRRANFDRHLRRTYGITADDYDEMLAGQGGGCAICESPTSGDPRRPRLHVDHCHDTGKVRGLLCSDCNRALGQFKDCPDRLVAAADYIRKAAM